VDKNELRPTGDDSSPDNKQQPDWTSLLYGKTPLFYRGQVDLNFSNLFSGKENVLTDADLTCPVKENEVAIPTQLPYGLTNVRDCTLYSKGSKAVEDYNLVKQSVVKVTGDRTYLSAPDGTAKTYSPYASGFFVSHDGLIATDLHPLQGLKNITVSLDDGRKYKAFVAAVDRRSDIAILRLDNSGDELFKPLALGSSQILQYGDNITGWGYPLDSHRVFMSPGNLPDSGFRERDSLKGALEDGAGRALSPDELNSMLLGGEQANREVLETDILVNHGNSGGPLTDKDRQVVGIIGLSDIRNQTIATPVEPIVKLLNYAQQNRPNVYFDEEDLSVADTAERRQERLELRSKRLELEVNTKSFKVDVGIPPFSFFDELERPRMTRRRPF